MPSKLKRQDITRSLCLALAALCVLLAGCEDRSLIKRFTPPEAEAAAKHYVDLLVQKHFDAIEHDLDPSLVDSNISETLAKMAAFFPDEAPKSVKVVGAHSFQGPASSKVEIVLEYEFPHTWLLASVATETTDRTSRIIGFHVNQMPSSLEEQNRFTLRGKGGIQYFALALAALVQIFSLYVLVVCARTKNVPLKWLWIVFILFGFGKLSVNWTTGAYNTMLLALQIPVAMASKPLYGPWTLAISLPLGAILYMFWRARNRPAIEANAPAPLTPSQPETNLPG